MFTRTRTSMRKNVRGQWGGGGSACVCVGVGVGGRGGR